jgi:HD-GYP domain-containing protein (c-di-GMP phosphodiesterase class II)
LKVQADKHKANVERVSKGLINQLAAIIRTSQIHDPSNVAVLKNLEKFVAVINSLVAAEGSITIEVLGEYFYVNESRVKFSMEHLLNFDFLLKEFKRLKLGSIKFLGRVTIDDMLAFLRALISASFSDDPFAEISEALESLPRVTVGVPRVIKDDAREHDVRRQVKRSYFSAVSFTKGVMKKIKSGETINAKRAKRVVQSLVDMLMQEEELLIGMTAIKDYDDYTYHHSVNVSILSMSLGQKLGFTKHALLELGLVALFHDIGKTDIPREVLNKPASFTEDEWKIMRKHPYWGVRAILNMKGFDLLSIRSAIAAFEHHLRLGDGGYPARRYQTELDLYSRIVSISDQYDGMTSARVYSRTPMMPEKALSILLEKAGSHIDPLLFKFFVNMVGVYPVGTAVMLDTRELALVYSNAMISPSRPVVMIISDPSGKKIQGYKVDLNEKLSTGHYKRSVTTAMDPAKYKINLAEYML